MDIGKVVSTVQSEPLEETFDIFIPEEFLDVDMQPVFDLFPEEVFA